MKSEESIFSKHSGAIATIIAAFIGGGFLLYVSIYSNNESEPSSEVIGSGEVDRSKNTLTAEDVLTALKEKKSTELQKNQFVNRNKGKIVQWRVIVNDVRLPFGSDDNRAFLLVFHPAYQKEKSFPDIIIASFSSDKEKELTSLSEGDFAIIEGKLDFQFRSTWDVSLEDSTILKFTKGK